jgi:hypothetical protein
MQSRFIRTSVLCAYGWSLLIVTDRSNQLLRLLGRGSFARCKEFVPNARFTLNFRSLDNIVRFLEITVVYGSDPNILAFKGTHRKSGIKFESYINTEVRLEGTVICSYQLALKF